MGESAYFNADLWKSSMLAQKVVKIKGETILDSEKVQICEWYGIFFRNLRNDLATSRQNA